MTTLYRTPSPPVAVRVAVWIQRLCSASLIVMCIVWPASILSSVLGLFLSVATWVMADQALRGKNVARVALVLASLVWGLTDIVAGHYLAGIIQLLVTALMLSPATWSFYGGRHESNIL